jgi:mRNA-degrading endonuclease toxin of MazEF toxin-antitoxin module
LQQVQSVSIARMERRLGVLTDNELTVVRKRLADFLAL